MGVLKEFDNKSHFILIDGKYRRNQATEGRDVIDPATGNVIAEIMHEIANELLAMKAQLTEALTREMGKPYKESADEVLWSVSAIRYYAEIGRTDIGCVVGLAVAGHLNYTLKLLLGVVVAVQPSNYPMTLLAWEGAAALASGNAVIAKPSEYTSITTLLFAEPFNRHLPPGLFQILTGPVAPIRKVDSFDQALEYANNSQFGLGACLYTMDMRESIRASEELDAGRVWINAPLLDNDAGPFGGTRMSGMGRQFGPEGLEAFRKTKFVWLDPNCGTQDCWWFPYADGEAYPESR